MNREEVLTKLGNGIRDIMNSIFMPNMDTNEDFEKIKLLALYTDELLNDKKIKKQYEKQLSYSEPNEEMREVKLKTFSMIRNVLIHFPYYKKWSEVYITPEMLTWNKSWSTIKKYFDDNKGKNIHYSVYVRETYGGWKHSQEVDLTVPELKANTKLYLKDFISINDVIWTFCLIDSMLEYLNIYFYIKRESNSIIKD